MYIFSAEAPKSNKGVFRKNWWPFLLDRPTESILLRVPWTLKKIKPVNPKGSQLSIFIERTDAKAPIFWPSDVKNQLIGKGPDAGKDWGHEEKGVTEDKTVDGIIDSKGMSLSKLQETVKDRQAWCASVYGSQRVDMTEQLNNNNWWGKLRVP